MTGDTYEQSGFFCLLDGRASNDIRTMLDQISFDRPNTGDRTIPIHYVGRIQVNGVLQITSALFDTYNRRVYVDIGVQNAGNPWQAPTCLVRRARRVARQLLGQYLESVTPKKVSRTASRAVPLHLVSRVSLNA